MSTRDIADTLYELYGAQVSHSLINKTIHLVLGIHMNGHKELMGMWIAETEGAKY